MGLKGQDDPGGPGLDGQLGVWQVELWREGCKEGKEESFCSFRLHPGLVMCWAADEVKKGLETSNHLLLTNLPGRARLACEVPDCLYSSLFRTCMAARTGGLGDSWLTRRADIVSPKSHVCITHPWLQLAPAWHPTGMASHSHLSSPRGWWWMVCRVGCVLLGPGPSLSGARSPLEDCRLGGQKGDRDKLSHCCQQSFQGNSFFPVPVPPWIRGLREALATKWYPAAVAGHPSVKSVSSAAGL